MAITNIPAPSHQLPPGRLWFGFAGAAFAWVTLGIADLLITWQVCENGKPGLGPLSGGAAIALYVAVTISLFAATLIAAVIAYRNWRRTAAQPRLANAEAVGREEFMGLTGLFVAVSFIVGIIWLGLPFALLSLCARAR